MKSVSKCLLIVWALLVADAVSATRFCSTTLDASNTGAVAGEWTTANGQNLTFTATKTAANKTLFQLASSTSTLIGLYEAVLQIDGGGATTDFGAGWTVVGGVLQKEVTWTTYPTGNIQIYLVARRNNSGGGSDIMGCQILNIDVSSSCPKPIYFINTPSWATPYAYLWNGGDNNGWPGVAMTNSGITTSFNNYSIWSIEHGIYVNAKFSNNGANGSGDQLSFTEGRYFNYEDDKWYSSENTLNINAGGWQTIDFEWINTSKTTVTAQIDLDAATTYEFYLHGTDYFKNNGTMTSSNCTNWKMNEDNNCHITTEYAGTYTFNYDFATNHLSVVYPLDPATLPHASGEHFGTAQALNVATYQLADNKPNATTVSTVSYYIVDCGEQLIFKAKTNGSQTFATNPWSVQLRSWNDAKTGFQENWAKQFTDANKTALVRLGEGNQNNWNGTHADAVPMTMYIEGLGANCSPDWIDYRRGYINNPIGDITPPTITDATDADAGANFTITISGGNDDSGNWFYYIEDTEHDFYQVSLENVITIPKNSKGITYNFDCYVIDFDGNKSVAKQASITMPFDPVQNLALNQPAYAGYGENPQLSNNGNLGDRWGSSGAPKDYSLDWWYVDLGAKYDLTEVDIFWEGAYAENFYIQVATENPAGDESKWTTVHTQTTVPTVGNAEANKNVYDITGSVGRWVRIKSTLNSLGNAWGMSIWEVRVYGSGVASDDANPPTMTSAAYISNNVGRTGVILELYATDIEGDVNKFRVVEVGGATANLTTDGSNRATLDGLTSGTHTYHIYAVDAVGNVSTNYETVSVCFLNPAENLAVGKTAVSGRSRTTAATGVNEAEQPQMAVDGYGGSGAGIASRPGGGISEHRQWGMNLANFPTKAWWAVDLGQKYQLSNIDIYWTDGDGNAPRSYLIQVSNESPADFANDAALQNLAWETVRTVSNAVQNIGEGAAHRNRFSFTTAQNVVARYIRIVNLDDTRIAMYLREVEVFAHNIICNDNRPTMVSAETISTVSANATVELHADDAEDGSDAVQKFKLVELISGVPTVATFVNTNASNRVTLADLTTGTHEYNIYAIDTDGNLSSNYESLTICVCNTTENLALNKPVVAGYTPGNEGEVPTKANDGALNSFWTTYNDRPIAEHWWSVDLGGVFNLSRIEVSWLTNTQSNHYLIQVAHVAPADRADDLQWYTVREVDQMQVSGASGADDKNSYSISTTARYVRIKMLSREAAYIAMKEFRVFGSACADLDNAAPIISSATVVSSDATTGQATIQITASDNLTSTVNTYIITNTATSERAEYIADGTNCITLSGFDACAPVIVNIQAKDEAANISAVYPLVVTVTPSSIVNLAPTATVMAGFTEGISNVANAVDGNLATQWQSTGATAGTNEWYTIDLGRIYDLNEVKIRWGLVAGVDDGGDYPTDFRLQVSDNNTTWASFAHYAQPTPIGSWLDVTSTDPLPARYVRVWVDNHAAWPMGIREIEVYSKNACYVADGKPVITLAELTAVNPTSVNVHCESWAAGKTHDQIRYYYELTNNSTSVTTTGTQTHTTGNFTFDGLSKGVNYTARIYAEIISNGVRSLNYKELTFSVTYSSLHYLTEETECNWEAGIGKHEWQFKYTDNYAPTELDGSGDPLQILSYTDHTIIRDNGTPPTIQYKLYEAGIGSIWTLGGNLYFRNPKDKHLIMYALGTEKFVCNLDELYVSGEAVGGWWTATNTPNSATAADYRMTYNEETGLFSWTGDVVPGVGKYFKIVIRDIRSNNPAEDTWAFSRIMNSNQTYEREWTRATLYFDMQTWTWWWKNAMGGCTREGGPGTHNKDNDSQAFTDGYKFDTYVQTTAGNDYLVIEAEPLDAALDNAGALHFYTGPTADVFEVTAKETKTYHDIDGTSHTYYRYKVLMSNIPTAINNIIRYCVKFEGPAGLIRITKYHYFDLENHECAPDFNVFYHSSDPNVSSAETSDPLDAVYEFDGGQLVQPILYRRKFDPGEWHSICIPFVVDSVRVWDEDDNCYYKLEPLWNNGTRHDADYWLRTFDNEALVRETAFKDNWDDPAVEHYVPEKDVPYIIRFPKGSYYRDKYVEFVGRWYQTIVSESAFSRPSVSTPGSFLYAGNNTMKRINMAQPAYYLNDNYTIDGQQYFVQRETAHTLMPFECYVVSDAETMTRVKIIGRRSQVITDIDNTEWNVNDRTDYSLYSVTGQLIITLRNRTLDEVRQHCQTQLSDGCYMLRSANLTLKIIVGGK